MDPERLMDLKNLLQAGNISGAEQMILETPRIVNAPADMEEYSFLHWACEEERVEVIRLLLDHGSDVNAKDRHGDTALHIAVSKNRFDVVNMLLDRGIDPNIENEYRQVALCYAHTVEMAVLLLNNGAKFTTGNDQMTLLHFAALEQNIGIIDMLLDRHVDINVRDQDGNTPLHKASKSGKSDAVAKLLQRGANPNMRNKENMMPLDLAYDDDVKALLVSVTKYLPFLTVPTIKSRDVSITSQIGSTLLSTVYRGKYRGTDVAIKMVRGVVGLRVRAQDQQELEILSRLRHPRVLSLMGIVYDLEPRYGSEVGLMTEYMVNGTLYAILHDTKTPPELRLTCLSSKLRVLRDVADAMNFLHQSKVIHRDLKSMNVLLNEDGRAKVCDFGASKLLSADMTHASTGGVGTPPWSSPEALLEMPLRESTDVYSFGVILWETLTGAIPWKDLSAFQVSTKVTQGASLPIPTPSEEDVPQDLIEILQLCLQRNPDQRPTFDYLFTCFVDLLHSCKDPCPDIYRCPISHAIMIDPVICSDGHTYERTSIEYWLREHDTSPMTNLELEDRSLRPNIILRGSIRGYLAEANA